MSKPLLLTNFAFKKALDQSPHKTALMTRGIPDELWQTRISKTKDGQFTYRVFDSYSLRRPEDQHTYTSPNQKKQNEVAL